MGVLLCPPDLPGPVHCVRCVQLCRARGGCRTSSHSLLQDSRSFSSGFSAGNSHCSWVTRSGSGTTLCHTALRQLRPPGRLSVTSSQHSFSHHHCHRFQPKVYPAYLNQRVRCQLLKLHKRSHTSNCRKIAPAVVLALILANYINLKR